MILVDIGNSGLKAVAMAAAPTGDMPHSQFLSRVIHLSWSAIGEEIRKARPEQVAASGGRWSELGDREALRWVVSQFASAACLDWRIASVNRHVHEVLADCILEAHPRARIRQVHGQDVGLPLHVDFPDKVGIDRVLAARAAIRVVQHMGPARTAVIVVQAGTALTVDWVDEQGAFCGGAILPGVGLSLQYLAAGTDKLPWLPSQSITDYPSLPGKNTEQAIAAGVHAAVVGGARFLIERYRHERAIPVVVSGGDGQLLRSVIEPPVHFVENLVLVGLSLCQTT